MQPQCITIPCHTPTNSINITTCQQYTVSPAYTQQPTNSICPPASPPQLYSLLHKEGYGITLGLIQPPVSAPPCPCCCATKAVVPSQKVA